MQSEVELFLTGLESAAEYSRNTRLSYANDLRSFVGYLTQALERSPQVPDLTCQYVTGYLRREQQVGRQHSTLSRRLAALRRFARFLNETGKLAPNPLLNCQAFENLGDIVRPAENGVDYLKSDEIASLWRALDQAQNPRAWRDAAMLALLLELGLSVGALVSLDLLNLDLRAGRLRLYSEEEEEITLSLGSAKSPLIKYLETSRPDLVRSTALPALFVSQMGGRMSRQGVWQVLRNWGDTAGLSRKLSPRLLRHTAVRRMLEAGSGLQEIQNSLGHRNPLSTRALLRRLKQEPTEALAA